MDGTWAPKSPDLSSYYSSEEVPLHPQHQGYRGSVSHVPPPFITPSSSPAHYDKPAPPALQPQLQPQQFMPRGVLQQESMQDAEYMPDESVSIGKMPDAGNGTGGGSTLPPNVDSIIIKNHFPVARIKRIMQADDDVGKVAQVTPVVVSKALELFMISLVTKAAAEAKTRNSKRVNTLHLKQAITNNEQFDFLNDIVSKVADAPEKSEGDGMDAEGGKKKKPASRKKKKTDDDDDF